MTDVGPQTSRTNRLAEIGVTYPFWIFDVDQGPWPRKITSIPAGSKGAKITGWYKWPWEYGTSLRRIDDPLPTGVVDNTPKGKSMGVQSVQRILNQLRYDDRFPPDTFRVCYEVGETTDSNDTQGLAFKDFCSWVHDPSTYGYIAPRRIVRIERRWDGVPFWDRTTGIDLLHDAESQGCVAYGIASLVQDDAAFLQAAGASPHMDGTDIRKAEFEIFQDEFSSEQVKGIVWPVKSWADRGLTLSRGPDFEDNRKALAGTILQNAPWSEIEDYVKGNRRGPLI